MEHNQMPSWACILKSQIDPSDWCIPVELIWRRHGWVPPSKECPATMAKQVSFRTWQVTLPAGETIALNQLPAQESHHG